MEIYLLNISKINEQKYIKFLPKKITNKLINIKSEEIRKITVASFLIKSYIVKSHNLPLSSLVLNNKPYIKAKNLFFSISHKYPYIAFVFNKKPIGIDIEFANKFSKNITERMIKHIKAQIEQNELYKRNDLIKIWTIKEAIFKMQNCKYFIPSKIPVLINKNNSFIFGRDKKVFIKTKYYNKMWISCASFNETNINIKTIGIKDIIPL